MKFSFGRQIPFSEVTSRDDDLISRVEGFKTAAGVPLTASFTKACNRPRPSRRATKKEAKKTLSVLFDPPLLFFILLS
jgi:hypothetical protein